MANELLKNFLQREKENGGGYGFYRKHRNAFGIRG